jgi:4-amino-4-deoxy-L-arabinose transferase-like glycosyltransferase
MGLTKKLLILGSLSFIVLIFNAWHLMLYPLDEAKNAEAAREMLEAKDWVVPTFNYELRTDKPPAHYYFMMGAYTLFGVNEFSARFFSAIMGMFTILITFLFARKFFNEQSGWWASLCLLASLHFNIQFHMAVPDPYLIFFFTASLFSFYSFFKLEQKRYLFAFYVFTGLGVLSKGPVAIALPGLIILLFLLLSKELNIKRLKSFNIPLGILMVLIICLPWYLMVHLQTDGEWTRDFFLKHNLSRYSESMEGHGGIFLITPTMVLIGMLPFSVFFISAFKKAWALRKQSEFLFTMLAVGIVVAFFSTSGTKLPNYTVPSYPFFALILGYFIQQSIQGKAALTGSKIAFIVLGILGVALCIMLFFVLKNDKYLSHIPHISIALFPMALGGFIAIFLYQKGKISQAYSSIALGWILSGFTFFGYAYPTIDRENPVAKTLPNLELEFDFYHYKRINAAYLFYIRKPIPRLESVEEIKQLINKGKSFYLITRTTWEAELNEIEGLEFHDQAKDIFETPTTLILKYSAPK